LLGAPGSGKGVQAELIVENYKITHVSTGNILREAVEKKTDLGQQALKYMKEGLLVPDELIIQILEKELESPRCERGFVLDGVPRTIVQAEALDKSLRKKNKSVDRVIYLEVAEETLVKRLTNRRTCVKCGRVYNLLNATPQKQGVCDTCGGILIQRVDDKEETVRKRFTVYEEQTRPLLDFYERRKNFVKIQGDRDKQVVFGEIKLALDKI
jgi:adenylate kinase